MSSPLSYLNFGCIIMGLYFTSLQSQVVRYNLSELISLSTSYCKTTQVSRILQINARRTLNPRKSNAAVGPSISSPRDCYLQYSSHLTCVTPVIPQNQLNAYTGYLSSLRQEPPKSMNRPCSPSVINALYRRYLFQAISDFTAVATSAVAIFSHAHFSRSSDILRSTRSSYSFRETSRLISAYCSLVISADFQ